MRSSSIFDKRDRDASEDTVKNARFHLSFLMLLECRWLPHGIQVGLSQCESDMW